MSASAGLYQRLGYRFKDESLLRQALTHRSAAAEHYERLEFLGDAVLSFVVAAALFQKFPLASEGQLSRLRAGLVRGDTLAVVARGLELGEHLVLGGGELKSGGFRRDSILADALEAIFGAVYLDGGVDAAREVILGLFAERLAACSLSAVLKDPKTRLQEYLQSRGRPLPEYHVVAVEGEAHAQTFKVSCSIDGESEPTLGVAPSRRKAEQAAARTALEQLGQ